MISMTVSRYCCGSKKSHIDHAPRNRDSWKGMDRIKVIMRIFPCFVPLDQVATSRAFDLLVYDCAWVIGSSREEPVVANQWHHLAGRDGVKWSVSGCADDPRRIPMVIAVPPFPRIRFPNSPVESMDFPLIPMMTSPDRRPPKSAGLPVITSCTRIPIGSSG
mmetsp:Transcript_16971/g.35216  ORF Transcript_16971/g.35216 Transcript_16971/m.35216 type:complete len:162 (-) Transcript_16971:104-589(-)